MVNGDVIPSQIISQDKQDIGFSSRAAHAAQSIQVLILAFHMSLIEFDGERPFIYKDLVTSLKY
jgi:hypothetical protein